MSALLAISDNNFIEGLWNLAWGTAALFAGLILLLKGLDR